MRESFHFLRESIRDVRRVRNERADQQEAAMSAKEVRTGLRRGTAYMVQERIKERPESIPGPSISFVEAAGQGQRRPTAQQRKTRNALSR